MVDRVVLYRAPTTRADADQIADWLRKRVDAAVSVQPGFLNGHADDDLPSDLARARVRSPYDPETGSEMLGVIRYEQRALTHPERSGGVLYDGVDVQRSLNARLPAGNCRLDTAHIVLLDRVLATWGADGRWHKRVSVLGHPALVSVPGLYEAPAKPDSYYQAKQHHALLSGDAPPREVLEQAIEGEFLVEDDPRTSEACSGYVLQAHHFLETGEAFCPYEQCRLFNAHRQGDLVRAQLTEPEFCDRHERRYG